MAIEADREMSKVDVGISHDDRCRHIGRSDRMHVILVAFPRSNVLYVLLWDWGF